MKNKNAVALGKRSAKIRKEKYGHDSEYYRQLVKKRFLKVQEKKSKPEKVTINKK